MSAHALPDGVLLPVDVGPLVALALDPGKTTGYCIAVCDEELNLHVGEDELSLAMLHGLLARMIGCSTNLHIIYEDFEYRNRARTGLDLTPVKMIGVIELMQDYFAPFTCFYKQSAASGKAFWSDDHLKRVGAYQIAKKHGRDATRHLLQWAKFGPGGQWIDPDNIKINLVDMQWMIDWFDTTILEA